MQKLVAGLFAQLSHPDADREASREQLDAIIDQLQRQQIDLEQRLSTQSEGPQRRRLKIALEVAQLQQRKALSLRANLRLA